MAYAVDGKCHNSEPGTFNHECGEPAEWVGVRYLGDRRQVFESGFCSSCKDRGWEARRMVRWRKVTEGDYDGRIQFQP